MELQQVIKIISGLLTPVIAVITGYIAYQQWQTNKRALAYQLYERRIQIYGDVRNFLLTIFAEGKVDFDEIGGFTKATAEADFLFDKEITDFISNIRNHAIELRKWCNEYRSDHELKPGDYDHTMVVDRKHKELEWLVSQIEPAKELFKKHLRG